MSLIGRLASLYLRPTRQWLERAAEDPAAAQERTLRSLLDRAADTWFGRRHDFASIRTHADFVRAVPVADYMSRKDLFDRAYEGEPDVAWPGRIRYFARTSGTTGGDKRIPVSEAMRRSNARGVRALLARCVGGDPGMADRLFSGKLCYLGGSGKLRPTGYGGWEGDLSGIRTHSVPWWGRAFYEPGRGVMAIPDWERRLAAATERLVTRDVRFIAGSPAWVKVLFDRLCDARGVPVEGGLSRVWPNLQVFAHGGMSFEPYRAAFRRYFRPGHRVHFFETFTTTEGYVANQGDLETPGMEPLLENGVFFEFVPIGERGRADAPRLTIGEVEPGVVYAVVLSTNAGLWAYDLGDTVRFLSARPPRLEFAGRHKLTLNAFGEHLSGGEIARAVGRAAEATGARVAAFTAGPVFPGEEGGQGAHQYVVEFDAPPEAGLEAFAREIDDAVRAGSVSYDRRRENDLVIRTPEVVVVPPGTFWRWMKSRGRFDAQSKVPLCAGDRRFLDPLLAFAKAEG